MSTLLEYWEMAQLAQASYIDFEGLSNALVVDILRADRPNDDYQFSETQANRLISGPESDPRNSLRPREFTSNFG